MVEVNPYSTLSLCYDAVMDHVDYEKWVRHVARLLDWHEHEPGDVLELGCGTATFAKLFHERYRCSYVATDASEEMLRVARTKWGSHGTEESVIIAAEPNSSGLQFLRLEFDRLDFEDQFDTILLLYDGLNYLLHEESVLDSFERVYSALKSGGLFIFDQSTPLNSINNQHYFEDSGVSGDISYKRSSHFDVETTIHTTKFKILCDGNSFQETHRQKCYSGPHIQSILGKTRFKIEGGYSGFSLEPADTGSERIHWVVRKP